MSAKTQTFQSAGSNLRDTVNQTMNMIRGKDVAGYTLYFIDGTSKQPAGSSDNIFMPHVTIGRGPKCHIKFGESYKTVSREHASISAEGSTHVLNHNPNATNPTLVNNQPISGPYYLKNGDEIQFSMQGPRIRYNIQSTPKASSMGLTSRIGSAVGQAVKPYKRGLSILGVLLLGSMAFGGYTFIEGQETKEELVETNEELGKTKIELTETKQKQKENETQLRENQDKLTNSEEELQALQDKYEKESEENVKARKELERKIINERNRQKDLERRLKENEKLSEEYRVKVDKLKYGDSNSTQSVTSDENKKETISNDESSESFNGQVDFDKLPTDDVYYIYATQIEYTYGGKLEVKKRDERGGIFCGTGFLTNDNLFITARHNFQPYRFFTDQDALFWSEVEAKGGRIITTFKAENEKGDSFTFNTKRADYNDASDKLYQYIYDRKIKKYREYTNEDSDAGLESESFKHKMNTNNSSDWAFVRVLDRKGTLVYDRELSKSLNMGTPLYSLGFTYGEKAQSVNSGLSPLFSETKVAQSGLVNGVINTSVVGFGPGNSGGPVFAEKNGKYVVVGIVSGGLGSQLGVITPIANVQ